MTYLSARSQFDLMHPLFDAIAESDLTAPQAHLLITLFKFSDARGFCFPSYNKLLKYTKMSRNTLCKHIKSLVSAGWIEYRSGNKQIQQSNSYLINLERLSLTLDTPSKPLKPTSEPLTTTFVSNSTHPLLEAPVVDYSNLPDAVLASLGLPINKTIEKTFMDMPVDDLSSAGLGGFRKASNNKKSLKRKKRK